MTGWRERLGLGAVLAATFMTQADGFVVNVASPSIQRDLGAGFDQIQFIGAAYVIAFGALMVTGARLGDRVGHRSVFAWGVAGFTVTSLLCGVAPNAELLIAARFLQGATAAFMAPQVLSIIRTTVQDEDRRARVIGIYGVAIGLGVICGIAGGGVLVELDIAGLGWRPALLINVPIGVAILALGGLLPSAATETANRRLDVAGAALTTVAAPALLGALIFGPGGAWWTWLGVPIGLAVVAALVAQQRAMHRDGGEPLFPPHVVTAPGMRLALLAVLSLFATSAGLYLVFTYYLQTGLLLAPLTAALMFMPLGFGFAVSSAAGRWLGPRVRVPLPVVGCGLLVTVLVASAAVTQAPKAAQLPVLTAVVALAGFGQGLVVPSLVAGILGRVQPRDAGAASGIATTVTQFGLAFGVAVAGVCYRSVLGATPGDPGVPFPDHATAFAATAVLLALSATTTGLVSARLHRQPAAGAPQPEPQPERAAVPAAAASSSKED